MYHISRIMYQLTRITPVCRRWSYGDMRPVPNAARNKIKNRSIYDTVFGFIKSLSLAQSKADNYLTVLNKAKTKRSLL